MAKLEDYLRRIDKCLPYGGKAQLFREQNDRTLREIRTDDDLLYYKPDVGYGAVLHYYYIMVGITVVSKFALYEFPSCCAFCVSTQVEVTALYRRRGINKIGNELRQHIARESGYTALLCTDTEGNVAERKTLQANAFKDIYQIKNKRTRNVVNISVKEL